MAKKDDFLDTENVEEKSPQETESEESAETEAPEKIKVGEEEYTPEQLDRLVKLGKIGVEAEEKWNTPIEKVYPEFTKKSQELKEIKEKSTQDADAEIKRRQAAGETLDADAQAKVIREELSKHNVVFKDDLEKTITDLYARNRAAERLTETSEDVALEASKTYGINTTSKEILEHMVETGIRDPEKAFKDKFEKQLDTWKEKELGKKKGTEFVTEEASTAGGKKPPEVKITRDNLQEHLKEALKGS